MHGAIRAVDSQCKPWSQGYSQNRLLTRSPGCAGTRSSSTSRAQGSIQSSKLLTYLADMVRVFLNCPPVSTLPHYSKGCRSQCQGLDQGPAVKVTALSACCRQAAGLPAAACSLQWVLAGKPKACLLACTSLKAWLAGGQRAKAPGSSGPAAGEIHASPACGAADGGAHHILAGRAGEGGPRRLGQGHQGAPGIAAHRHHVVRACRCLLLKYHI